MKTVSFSDFRKRASGFITEVEHGETLIIMRHGKPVAEVIPASEQPEQIPSWKKPGLRLKIKGGDISAAIMEERERDDEIAG